MPMIDSAARAFAEDVDDDAVYDLYDSDDDDSSGENVFDDEAAARTALRFTRGGPTRFRPSPSVKGATVNTARGAAPVRFGQPVASAQAVERLKADVHKAIEDVRKEVRTNFSRVERTITRNSSELAALGRQVKAATARTGGFDQRSQLSAILPLLQGKPKIESITFDAVPTDLNKTVKATAKFEDDKMATLLPLLLLSGGLGGGSGGDGGGMSEMMVLAIALMK